MRAGLLIGFIVDAGSFIKVIGTIGIMIIVPIAFITVGTFTAFWNIIGLIRNKKQK